MGITLGKVVYSVWGLISKWLDASNFLKQHVVNVTCLKDEITVPEMTVIVLIPFIPCSTLPFFFFLRCLLCAKFGKFHVLCLWLPSRMTSAPYRTSLIAKNSAQNYVWAVFEMRVLEILKFQAEIRLTKERRRVMKGRRLIGPASAVSARGSSPALSLYASLWCRRVAGATAGHVFAFVGCVVRSVVRLLVIRVF